MTASRILLFVCLLTLVIVLPAQSSKTKQKVKGLKANLSKVRDERSDQRQKLGTVRKQMRTVKGTIEEFDNRMNRIADEIETSRNRLTYLEREEKRLAEDLLEANAEYSVKSAVAKRRLRYIRMLGASSVLTAFVNARDLSELASRKFFYETVARHDRQLFETVRRLRDRIAANKKRNEQIQTETVQLMADQRKRHAIQNELREDKQILLNQLTEKAEDIELLVKKLNSEEDAIQRRIESYLATVPGGTGTRPTGRLLMPVYGRFSSGFGMRRHPVLGRARMHAGQDIAAPHGTSIRAAQSGTVIHAGWMGGYGNAVIISHGGGLTTLYAHCSRLLVGSGQRVTRGQSIARVGSTGLSTGPHLHFEVAINGRKVNPRGWL